MSPSSDEASDVLLYIVAARRRYLKQRAQRYQHDILVNIWGTGRRIGGAIKRMEEQIDSEIAFMVAQDTVASIRNLLEVKAVIRNLVDMIDDTLNKAGWLKHYNYPYYLTDTQIQALDFITREVCPSLLGAVDLIRKKKEGYTIVGEMSAELSRHMHQAITGRPMVGETLWDRYMGGGGSSE